MADLIIDERETGEGFQVSWGLIDNTHVIIVSESINKFHSLQTTDPSTAREMFYHPYAYLREVA
jgi:hypothetical protein